MVVVARGQITIRVATDAYAVYQSIDKAAISCDHTGKVLSTLTINSVLSVRCGETPVTDFTIGAIATPTGFYSITVNQSNKTITYTVSGNNTTLADTGTVSIPVIINGQTFNASFGWFKVKNGSPGSADVSLPDWVNDWNSGKTIIDAQSVITPKIFAGTRNANGTITGMAIGKFSLATRNASGTIVSEVVNGIYGFNDGKKTFEINASGNVQLGNGNEYIKYNAATGKVEFGSAVSLNWVGATYIDANGIFTGTLSANTVNALRINASQIAAGTISADRIDVNALKASLITAGNIEALTLNVIKGTVGGWTLDADSIFRGTKNNTSGGFTAASGFITIGSNGIRGLKWRLESTGAGAIAGSNIVWDAAGNITFSSAVSLLWSNVALNAANSGKLYVRGTGLNHTATRKINLNGTTVAESSSRGLTLTVIARDTLVVNSTANYDVYGSEANCDTLATALNALGNDKIVILTSYDSIRINATLNTAIQRCGGSDRLITDERIPFAFVGIPGIGKNNGLFSMYGLGASEPYAELSTIVVNGVPQGISVNGQRNTFINGNGIYTGTLSANQITAGTIDAARLNVDALKAALITAGNIEALTLNVTKGIIGGWTINKTSISGGQIVLDKANNRIAVYGAASSSISGHRVQLYYNSNTDFGLFATDTAGNTVVQLGYVNKIAGWTINGTQIYKNSVYLGADGSITNGIKWKFNNDGSGQVANGNIVWDVSGNVTFASSVSLQWSTPINNITNALGGSSFPKMTYINSTGIYTGTLTATQVNAVAISASSITTGILSADRIAAGSINATKLDAASIKASIINTDYINGLSCTFVRGKIGGFVIGSDNMTVGSLGAAGQTPIQIRTTSSGSGYWYTGEYKPFGISLLWHQSANAGHIVIGQIAASGNSVKTGFIGIQMLAWDNTEYFCLSTNYSRSGSKEVYNRIAGWAFDHANIWKNSVYLGSDGSIYNGTKWRLNNDGSGRLANGNIVWDAAGNVSFGASVSLNWTNAANNALNSAKSYADTKKSEAINSAATDATNKANAAKELASAMAYGKMLFRDPTFFDGSNSTNVYNNNGNGTVTVTRAYDSTAPNDSKYLLRITNTGSASPGCGGFHFGHMCSYRKVFIARIIAKIPSGRTIQWASNAIGDGGWSKWLTSNVGTGDWCEYVYKVVCGTGNFSSTNFFYIEGSATLTWYVAYATVFDVTATERYTTTIDANGIYTGTLSANQINAGTLSADRIAAGSINSSKLDAASIKANIINTSYINGLSCTFAQGTIGGWYINSYQIYKNSVALSSDGSIINGSRWRLNNDGSGQLANGNITWDTSGNVTARGAVFNNVRIQGSVRNPFVLNDSSIWIGGDTSNQQNFNNYDNIIAIRGSWDENIALPWTLTNSGRRVTLVNYKWGSNTTVGYMTIYAPSGKYFFEDGIQKTSITFSREMVELLGYGDNATFFGWIVTNRRDVMCSGKYGSYLQCLASGIVTLSGTSASLKQKTFDGTRMSVSRTGTGRYTIYLPWSLSSNYFVQMTGYHTGTPIYATIIGIYSSYFYVQTQDDSSANEGSFCFQVFSTADWS